MWYLIVMYSRTIVQYHTRASYFYLIATSYTLINLSPLSPLLSSLQSLITTRLLSTSMDQLFLILLMSEILQYFSFCAWLISLKIMLSVSFHVTNDIISFLLVVNCILLCIYFTFYLSIYHWIDT